jgi:YceI-like domain
MSRVGKLVLGGVIVVALLAGGALWSRGASAPAPAALGSPPPASTAEPGTSQTGGTSQTVKADAKGRLTIHGTTREVTLPLQGRWNGDTIQVAGALRLDMSDYGIQPPRFGPVVSIDDAATMEVQLLFERG